MIVADALRQSGEFEPPALRYLLTAAEYLYRGATRQSVLSPADSWGSDRMRSLDVAHAAGVNRFIHPGTEASMFRGQGMVDIGQSESYVLAFMRHILAFWRHNAMLQGGSGWI